MDEGNFGQWRHFFESALGKFGLEAHIAAVTPDDYRDREWRRIDSCVVNWILTTVSKGVYDVVRRDHHDAFTLWHAIEDLFHDNELQRVVYLETELCSLNQGDMSMNDYCTKLKRIADQLHDIGHTVSEPSQVLNLLRGLSPKYRHVKPVITSKFPPHTFQSARSFLILEELSLQHDSTVEADKLSLPPTMITATTSARLPPATRTAPPRPLHPAATTTGTVARIAPTTATIVTEAATAAVAVAAATAAHRAPTTTLPTLRTCCGPRATTLGRAWCRPGPCPLKASRPRGLVSAIDDNALLP
jgi:hypothetical protein